MKQNKSPPTRLSRLVALAFISNFLIWSLLRTPDTRIHFLPLFLSYSFGVAVGWLINPFFIPRRDSWTKSPYERIALRITRAIFSGGLFAFLSQCISLAIRHG